MEIYTLNSKGEVDTVTDVYEDLIWTDRYADEGDFVLNLPRTRENRLRFTRNTQLSIVESNHVMIVEEIEDTLSEDGVAQIKLSGRSIEKLLRDRVAALTLTAATDPPSWLINGTPSAVIEEMFHQVCVVGSLSPLDRFDNLGFGGHPLSNIPFPPDSLAWRQEPTDLYSAIKNLADMYEMGFRFMRNPSTSKFSFLTYMGADRTTRASNVDLDPVIFSYQSENLKNIKQFTTIKNAKNVAYVYSSQGAITVLGEGYNATTTKGAERRVLFVKADDLPTDPAPSQASVNLHLTLQGLTKLKDHRSLTGVEGEVDQNSEFKYGEHYNVGDIVELRSEEGGVVYRRVTEHIIVSDAQGDRGYPTLTASAVTTENTWESRTGSEAWVDQGATTYWVDQF